VAHAVGYAVTGLGFYHVPHPPLSRKKDSKTTLVKIVGGSLSIDQVAAQLQRVVSSKWNWEPVAHEKDSFVVPFSSKMRCSGLWLSEVLMFEKRCVSGVVDAV
jgi:hypothetical protein